MEKRSSSSSKFSFHKEKINQQSSCMRRRLTDAINYKDGSRNNNQKLLSNNGSDESNDITGTEKQAKNSKISMKKQHQSSGNQVKKNHKNPKSQCEEDTTIPENELSLWSDEMCADKQKLAATLNEICHQISPSNFDEASKRHLELRANAFIHQIYISRISKAGDDDDDGGGSGSHTKSKQFLDAADILRLNMDVFVRFLRDPYTLFLKNIRNLQFLPMVNNNNNNNNNNNSRKKLSLESKSSERQICFVGNHQDLKGKVVKTTHESVQGIIKYENLSSTKVLVTSQMSNKTLPFMSKLRAKNKAVEDTLKDKNQQTTKATTKLFFKDVKQTIKQAVGENKKKLTTSINSKISAARSTKPYSDDFDERTNAKRRENKSNEHHQPAHNSKAFSKKMKSVFTGNHMKPQVHMSVEPKQQLSERFKNANLDKVLPKKELASYNPNRHWHNATTDRSLEIKVSNDPKKVELKPSTILDNKPSSTSDSKSFATLEANSVVPPGNTKVLAKLYEPTRVDDVTSNKKISAKIEAVKARAVNRLYRSFLGSSTPLHIQKLQIADGIDDKDENTSPMSVLESFSPDDVSSPTSIVSEPATSSLKQSRFRFDRASLNTSTTCMDREDTLYLYVRKIIQFSGMNFRDLFVRRVSLKRAMKSCPADGIASLAIELKCDYKLILDCIYEAMRGVYRKYYIRIQRLPVLQQDRVIPLEENFIDEVVKQVEFYFLELKTEQIPVNQLVGKDIAMCSSSSWFDVTTDTEDILIKVAEGVLLDSIVDTILEVQI